MRAIVGPGFMLAALVSGCQRAEEPGGPPPPPDPVPQSGAAPQPGAVPQPRAAAPPTGYAAPPPPEIPREALAYRDNFIRIWRFYFALAESPTIGFSQVHQESRWKASAKSVYASGLAQFTPATAADYALLLPPEVRAECPTKAGCPTDPNWALNALALYDYRLHQGYAWAATPDDRWRIALAAYNGGGGWITKERAKAGNATRWVDIVQACLRSAASCKENRDYPVVILEKWLPLYRLWLGL